MNSVKQELDRMLHQGIIKEVTEPTEWCAPMVPVVKKSGKIRICVDFKQLNKAVKRPITMLPNLEDIAPKLVGAKVFSTLDASSGFWQVPIAPESMPYTTFITPFGRYCFCRIPMGINFGPEEFQGQMSRMLSGLVGCDVIMDDIIIWGKSVEEHDKRLKAVLDRIKSAGLTLNKEKSQIRQDKVTYFGHEISKDGITASPEKVKAILEMPSPTNVTELRSLCGMMNYLSRFTPNLASTLKPITDLLKKDVVWNWGTPQQIAFHEAKKLVSSLPSLSFYQLGEKVIVSADASSYGLGATLLQESSEGLVPVAFASRSLTDSEKKYSQIEKECLASAWPCEKFRRCLSGLSSFTLWTDHKPLVPLMTTKDIDKCPVRCQRLLMRLMKFNYKVEHKPGSQLVIADALSRNPTKDDSAAEDKMAEEEVEAYVEAVEACWPISKDKLEYIRQSVVQNQDMQTVIGYVMNGWPVSSTVPTHLKKYLEKKSAQVTFLCYDDEVISL